MNPPVIIAKDVSVSYRPYADRVPTARRSLARLRHREQREVVALDRVSVTIRRGEAMGVIGRNGAGKSTLLRVLAGTLEPDSGVVDVRSEPPTLLQLGVGFNAKLSGRDNVYLGGLALGHSRARMSDLMSEIVEFAEIADAIDRPVNTYSSGMRTRLAFSIAMTLEPETLLLDELLAVGDAEFRNKSLAAMQELVDRTGTVVMVSHSLRRVRQFCDTAIWLDAGTVKMRGPVDDVIAAYESSESDDDGPRDETATRWNAKQRTRLVKRVLGGEKPASLADETGIPAAEIIDWRRRFVEGGRLALRPRLDADDD